MCQPDIRFIPCKCGDTSHHVIVQRFDWNEDDAGKGPEIEYSIAVTLSHYLPFWKRVWVAFKYVTGFREYSYYHEILIEEDDFRKISGLFDNNTIPLFNGTILYPHHQ